MSTKLPYVRRNVAVRVAVVTCATTVLTLAAVSWAIESFVGQTSENRGVRVTVGDDGLVRRASINWRADCRRPHARFTDRTAFIPPFRESTERYFEARGRYHARQGAYRIRVRVGIVGRHPSLRRWKGTFHARVRVLRHGQAYDRCETGMIRWATIRQ